MARRRPMNPWQFAVLLVLAVVVTLLKEWKEPTVASGQKDRPKTSTYEVITGCLWQDHKSNDGDSFHVRLPDGRVEQVRLYYVDAPESQRRTYRGGKSNHERIHQQAQALGLTDDQAVEIGQRAKARVHELLAGKPFTLHTRWDDPFNDRRYHAFVTPEGGGPFLEETLVREGLVRIHTRGAEMPDGTPVKARLKRLRELEKEAKQAGRGAWGRF
ncbi:thermonuclease family protein [Luteolibacter flavescens]|uniref:Thermonuclease family protein n=1 Tax=Luteolibacter flavescens TaxID=1859460 RepID=A0ABT3FVB3_9BACT|nr:thermonuclease family protein [Luteolibacter flavescens]MCW1887492.1 thermonuclease family protein [Luteolibacter flavescens]